jgi:hypothetical protein
VVEGFGGIEVRGGEFEPAGVSERVLLDEGHSGGSIPDFGW